MLNFLMWKSPRVEAMLSRAERTQNKQSFTKLIVLKCESLSSGHLEVSLAIEIKKVVVQRV